MCCNLILYIKIADTWRELGVYYNRNQLKSNPIKTEIHVFHLRNMGTSWKLWLTWKGVQLHHYFVPSIGVTLDCMLTYKKNCQKTKQKIYARSNFLWKLSGSNWGIQPQTLRTTALALCSQYTSLTWYISTHAKQLDVAFNESCSFKQSLITDCLKPNTLGNISYLAGIAYTDMERSHH